MSEKLLVAYEKLLKLNQQINRELKAGSTQLETLLAASWEVMQEIDSLPAPQGETGAKQVYVLLSQLVELHKENQELIRKRMGELSRELSQVKKGKAAKNAYQKRSEAAKFLDKLK